MYQTYYLNNIILRIFDAAKAFRSSYFFESRCVGLIQTNSQ